MSWQPNAVQRRARVASAILFLTFVFLLGSFFRTQVLQHDAYAGASESNRLREVPIPAARGQVYDRRGAIIAENIPGYRVSLLAPRVDSLRAVLRRLSGTVPLSDDKIDEVVRQFQGNATRPAVVFEDAAFEMVSVLEEHRVEYPGLIIQSTPKRSYPDGEGVASLMGYTGQITETELRSKNFPGYKPGQQVGKGGIERQYESRLRGREGIRFVEVDARGRVVREAGARQELAPQAAPPLYTNIDLDLQRYIVSIFGDSLQGAAVALEPKTGEVLALVSVPSYDANRFIGGIPAKYWEQLNTDPRRPLYNKALQGLYPPGSTWKLATAIVAMQNGLVKMDDYMRDPCTGGWQYGNRFFKCHKKEGHGLLTLAQAIEQSCDAYFYQLSLRINLNRLVEGGIALGAGERSGIDLPGESRPAFPRPNAIAYYDAKFGKNQWNQSLSLSLAIGQGDNSQTLVNVARFYAALANGGEAPRPQVIHGTAEKDTLFKLDSTQLAGIHKALAGVVARGTAAASKIEGLLLAGKTGTAQSGKKVNGVEQNHAWFAGYAPADAPQIVVVVMIEFGGHGTRSAHIASKIFEHFLRRSTKNLISTEGDE